MNGLGGKDESLEIGENHDQKNNNQKRKHCTKNEVKIKR